MSSNTTVSRRQRMLSIIALAIIVAPMVLGAAIKLTHAQPASSIMRIHAAPPAPMPENSPYGAPRQ